MITITSTPIIFIIGYIIFFILLIGTPISIICIATRKNKQKQKLNQEQLEQEKLNQAATEERRHQEILDALQKINKTE